MMSHHEEHDEFGGLHRDLLQTGATLDRRQLLRAATKFGLGFGALQLLGCSSYSSTDYTTGSGNGSCTNCDFSARFAESDM